MDSVVQGIAYYNKQEIFNIYFHRWSALAKASAVDKEVFSFYKIYQGWTIEIYIFGPFMIKIEPFYF
jgi:hypothetical protein